MKRFLKIGLLAVGLCVGSAGAQVTQESVSVTNIAPSGPCTVAPLFKVSNQGTYQCVNSTWTLVGPGGGSTGQSVSLPVPIAGTSHYGVDAENGGATIDTVQGFVSYLVPYPSTDLSLVYINAQQISETCGPAGTITSSIEYPPDSGNFRQVFFDGQPSVNIAPCGIAKADKMAIETTATAQTVRSRTLFKRSSTDSTVIVGNWAYGNIIDSAGNMTPYTTTTAGGHWDGVEELTTRTVTDGVCTASSAVLTSATAAFTAQDAGQNIVVSGCGAAGATLPTTIATVTNATTVQLATTATTAATGVSVAITPKDKTMGGTIYDGAGRIFGYAPYALFGKQVNGPTKAIGCVGDSITAFAGDNVHGTWCPVSASYQNQLLNVANLTPQYGTIMNVQMPYINEGMSGEYYLNLAKPTIHTTRYAFLDNLKVAFVQLGTNDIANGESLAQMQTSAITVWQQIAAHGPKEFVGTIPPRTGSTDFFLTTQNQTFAYPLEEPNRVILNTWLRDGAPLNCPAMTAAAAGSTGANIVRVPYYDLTGKKITGLSSGTACVHPLTGTVEMADGVESGRNTGKWNVDPRNVTYTGCNIAAGVNGTITCSSGGIFQSWYNFVQAALYGAGTSGGNLTGQLIYQSPTTMTFNGTVPTACTNCTITLSAVGNPNNVQNYGPYTSDGIHPSAKAMPLFSQGVAGIIAGFTW